MHVCMHACFDKERKKERDRQSDIERKKERDRQSMSEREREGGICIDRSLWWCSFYVYVSLLCICLPSMYISPSRNMNRQESLVMLFLCIFLPSMYMSPFYVYFSLLCIFLPQGICIDRSLWWCSFYVYFSLLCIFLPSMYISPSRNMYRCWGRNIHRKSIIYMWREE